ncbi:flagellar hook-basal body complex protein [Catenovulum sediminis]|uniref:flagellar hook-basal body complex protein n=1 Tax=Catenovulum sediminis TaxID=1740262 RepID=UPI00117F2244|nr:flagellar hook-basal body complex protein [Catenovulum sediminis]
MSQLINELSSVMQTEIKAIEVTAQNTANVNSIGYKTQLADLQVTSGTNFSDLISGVELTKSTDLKQGGAKVTSNLTDLALLTQGWFAVNKDGVIHLTRNGQFSINERGVLVTQAGDPVITSSGYATGLDANSLEISVKGQIFSQGKMVDQFIIYQTNTKKLFSAGDGLYTSQGQLKEVENFKILQGALETSNVDVSAEMLRVIEKTRHIETLQRAMSTYDEMLKTGINQIGK